MAKEWLIKLEDTQWSGTGELWLDPEGNVVERCHCTLKIKENALHYTWSYQDQSQNGKFTFSEAGASWIDSWHQPEQAICSEVKDAKGLFTVEHIYNGSPSNGWAWRSKLSKRPDDSLVLQMTNITPWGEESRAVRMIFTSVSQET
ncbi:MAG: hypothetical protein V7785_09555 [Bermanella sp.]